MVNLGMICYIICKAQRKMKIWGLLTQKLLRISRWQQQSLKADAALLDAGPCAPTQATRSPRISCLGFKREQGGYSGVRCGQGGSFFFFFFLNIFIEV